MLRKKKTAALILLIFVLAAILVPVFAYAEEPGAPKQPVEDTGSLGEHFVAKIINGLVIPLEWLGEIGGIQTLDKVIYDTSGDSDMSPLTAEEWAMAQKWYTGIAGATISLLMIGVVYSFFKTAAWAAYNPAAKSGLAQDIGRWVIALVLVAAMPYLFTVFSGLNTGFVRTIQGVAQNMFGQDVFQQLSGYGAGGSFVSNLHTGSVLGTAIAKIVLLGIQVWVNLLFKIRKIMLLVMLVFAPVAIYLWSIRGEPQPLTVLFGELASNFFMQTAYALVFAVFATFVRLADMTWLDVLIWLFLITAVTEVIRNVLQSLVSRWSGVNEAGIAGKAMALAGGGALVGMSQVLRGNRLAMADFSKMPKPEGVSGGSSGGFGGGGGTADFSGSPDAGALYRSSYSAAKWGGIMASGVSTAGALLGGMAMAAVPGGEHLGTITGQAAGMITGGTIRAAGTSAGLARKTWQNMGTNSEGPLKALKHATGSPSTWQAPFRAGRIVARNTLNPAGTHDLLQKYGSRPELFMPESLRQIGTSSNDAGSGGNDGTREEPVSAGAAAGTGGFSPECPGGIYTVDADTGSAPPPPPPAAAGEKTFKPTRDSFSLDNMD